MPPVFAFTLGMVGAATAARWLVSHAQRVNAELDAMRAAMTEPVARERLPTLRRDPMTGEYRPG